ncbi:MAG: hypothetical protein LBQ22_00105 [Bacteroidales bacterium]|jgi:hypothetical protein|nr:hypothetical protein [Bacteroidales bacterium]
MLKNFKYKYGFKKLQAEFCSSVGKTIVTNLSNAKSIGIIYDATTTDNFEKIKVFVNELRSNIPEIIAIGYVNQKELDDNHIKPQGFEFFCQKDTNWFHKPLEQNVIDFTNKPFDILIDFDFNNNLAIKFVVVESKSTFKVGKFESSQNDFYDLTLNINKDQEDPLSYFIEQVKVYLNMIKTS